MEKENFLKLKWGKFDISHGISTRKNQFRVPFNAVAFHPIKSNVFCLAGGSIVSICELVSTSVAASQLNPDPDSYDSAVDGIYRWLHGKSCDTPLKVKTKYKYTFHSPTTINFVSWSESGKFLLVGDSSVISILNVETEETIASFIGNEFFDGCFIGDEYVLLSSIKNFGIYSTENLKLMQLILIDTDGYVRSMSCKEAPSIYSCANVKNPATSLVCKYYRLAITTNTYYSAVYELIVKQGVDAKISSENNISYTLINTIPNKFFKENLTDTPLDKQPSFSCCSRYVAFPFACRKQQHFALLLDLDCEVDPYRFRGHQSSICAVAFSNCRYKNLIDVTKILTQSAENLLKQNEIQELKKLTFVEYLEKYNNKIQNSSLQSSYTLFAIACVNGMLSIWLLITSNNDSEVSAICLTCTPNSIIDQTAVITSISWSATDEHIIVTSDDGKVTCIQLILKKPA